jgi:hypothetical protein
VAKVLSREASEGGRARRAGCSGSYVSRMNMITHRLVHICTALELKEEIKCDHWLCFVDGNPLGRSQIIRIAWVTKSSVRSGSRAAHSVLAIPSERTQCLRRHLEMVFSMNGVYSSVGPQGGHSRKSRLESFWMP